MDLPSAVALPHGSFTHTPAQPPVSTFDELVISLSYEHRSQPCCNDSILSSHLDVITIRAQVQESSWRSSLSRANTTATLKNLQEILLVPSQFLYLSLWCRMLATNVSHFVAKGLTLPLVLQLVERELRSVVRSIKANALHPRLQRDTLLPLLFGAITQIV